MGDPTDTVTMVDVHGDSHEVPRELVQDATIQGFHVEGGEEHVNRVADEAKQAYYSTPGAKVVATGAALLRGASGGLSDVGLRALYGDSGARELSALRDVNPGLSMAGDAVGALVSPIGGVGKAVEGGIAAGSALGRIGAAAVGYGAEGALYGAGAGISELALDDRPITMERVAGSLSSNMLYGGLVGGAAGSIGKLAELGLSRARTTLAEQAARTTTDDLAAMDVKQLRAAREAELDSIKTSHKADLDAIEESRVAERQSIADDLKDLKREVKDTNQWATTKDVKYQVAEGRLSAAELGRTAAGADKQLARLLDNPIGLAKNPTKALDALQRQESALVNLLDHQGELRAAYGTGELSAKRIAALEAAPQILEKNRAIQARIAEVTKPLPEIAKTSPRLDAIDAAREQLSAGKANPLASIPQRMLEGSTFGAVTGAVAGLAIPGAGMAAPMVGAAVSKMLGEKVLGGLGKAASGQAARAQRVALSFVGKAERATTAAVPIATKVLASVRYGQGDKAPVPAKASDLARHFNARADEVRKLVEPDPVTGGVKMREDARAKVTEHLSPVGNQFPLLADALESIAARRAVFLYGKLPKKPDAFGAGLGPDLWQPSDMEMRKWARYVAGVEDPGSIMDRVAHGSISPEDGEVMREVYPEMLADLQQQIFAAAQRGTTKTIPYTSRLALSRLTGIPVDPTTDPRILSVIQAAHQQEAGTEGGTQQPRAQPQFGSVSRSLDEPTRAQKRAS